MKNSYKYITTLLLVCFLVMQSEATWAGNEDRSGQAGAGELLINPWARSSGWGGVNTSCVKGIEAQHLNVAGMAFTEKTEMIFSNIQWMKGSGIKLNTFGFSQKVGESGTIGFAISSMSFGDIEITTVDLPDGGVGKYSPSYLNIALSYAKVFSNSIYGGMTLKVINEQISDATAQGVALDAGIQYVTGEKENIKFGISMKNVGTPMKFSGDGLSFRGTVPGAANQMTVAQRSAKFELPSLINIGAGYDFLIGEKVKTLTTIDNTKKEKKEKKEEYTIPLHRITLCGNFTSNSFTRDLSSLGVEYSFSNLVMLRGAYGLETGKADNELVMDPVNTGWVGGFSVELPLKKDKKTTFAIDYSYRDTNPFEGTHSIGARINL